MLGVAAALGLPEPWGRILGEWQVQGCAQTVPLWGQRDAVLRGAAASIPVQSHPNKMGEAGGAADVHELSGAEAQVVFFPPGRASMAVLGLDLGYRCHGQWVEGFLCIRDG